VTGVRFIRRPGGSARHGGNDRAPGPEGMTVHTKLPAISAYQDPLCVGCAVMAEPIRQTTSRPCMQVDLAPSITFDLFMELDLVPFAIVDAINFDITISDDRLIT
jgi:hypothetical protein